MRMVEEGASPGLEYPELPAKLNIYDGTHHDA